MPTFILIRHAEKLTWPTGTPPSHDAKAFYIDDHQLSGKGLERSHALVGYFLHRKEMLELYESAPLAAIVCQAVNPNGKGKSERPKQTIYPLYEHLSSALTPGVVTGHLSTTSNATQQHPSRSAAASLVSTTSPDTNIKFMEYTKSQFADMVTQLRTDPQFHGKTVIISWSHQTLPHLALALGASPNVVPAKWGKRFDVTWVVRGNTLQQYAQKLLYGDQDDVFKVKAGGCVGQIEQETAIMLNGVPGGNEDDGEDDDE
ncbi:hypothetical protein HDU99_002600 [Rhizoclosmatium hyalinum]|nr:hypothetical protein HDU99_002600 [Rhizoclosmatium hyalinum]